MLLLLVFFMLLASAALCIIRHDRRSLYIFLTCTSLLLFITGILIYIAKKGGISRDTVLILYGLQSLKGMMQYLRFTLAQLGYYVAIGRYIFPPLLILTALDMSYFPLAVKLKKISYIFFILPIISLSLYVPTIFRSYIVPSPLLLKSVVLFTRIWIFVYLGIALAIIIYEYFAITSLFFRRRFISKSLLLASMAVLYGIYAPQDPAQIYLFYNNDFMWMLGLWYLSAGFNTHVYSFVIILSLSASVIGLFSIFRYVSIQWDEEREEAVLEEKGRYATEGVGIFFHATKNELLASRILIERLKKDENDRKSLERLDEINSKLLKRVEKLYSSVRPDTMYLVSVPLKTIITDAVERSKSSYPDALISVDPFNPDIVVFADKEHLTEALSNLIINGWEANLAASSEEAILVSVSMERLWTVISVQDRGRGIPSDVAKHIFEPFYSSKNSSNNWGMGMYYVRRIVKANFGYIRFEKRLGGGTRFIMMLPRSNKGGDEE